MGPTMLERLSLPNLPVLPTLPELPSLGGAAKAARAAVGRRAQAVGGFAHAVSAKAADALQRVERPSLTLPEFPFTVPGWLASRFASSSADLTSLPASTSAAATIEGWEKAVGNAGLTWDHFFPIEGQNWSDRVDLDGLTRFLRAQHPDKTHVHVSALTKLPADTVKKWLLGVAAPGGRAMLVLACVYGPEIMVAMLRDPPAWLDAAARAAEQARLEAQVAQLQAKLGRAA